MSRIDPTPDLDEEILARFVRALAGSNDHEAVVRAHSAEHPHLAEEFRALAAMNRMVDGARPEAAPEEPERLGEFRVVRRIARGGMGEIYEAVQERLGRRVAIKTIRRGRISPEARDRFLREQRFLARLHQTHIVPIHTAGEEGALQYLAMPYIEGAALHHVVRAARDFETAQPRGKTPSLAKLAGMLAESHDVPTVPCPEANAAEGTAGQVGAQAMEPLPSRQATAGSHQVALSLDYFRSVAEVMADAADAIHQAHQKGILHRDVKPSNIMVDTQEQCWIIDFGLAGYLLGRHGSSASGPEELAPEPVTVSQALGTPEYMAPEQWAGGQLDARTDVWGLGATLYELLSLRRAFSGASQSEIHAKVKSQDPVPPHELVRNVPADLAAICHKALRKEPAGRYQSAREFANDLRRWLGHEPALAHPWRTLRRPWCWAQRNAGWALTMALALIGLFGSLALWGLLAMEARQTADARADAAEAREEVAVARADRAEAEEQAAEARAGAAEDRARASESRALVQQLQQFRLTSRRDGWSANAWMLVRQLTQLGAGTDIRNQAAATLAGLDAHLEKPFKGLGASAVAFDATGQRVIIGGVTELRNQRRPGEGAKVWDRQREQMLYTSSQPYDGPVAFRADGTPLQLVADPKDRHVIRLWDVARNKQAGEFRIVPAEPLAPDSNPELVLTSDGATVAAIFPQSEEKALVVVWDAASGQVVYQTVDKATALAVSQDRTLLAQGDADGRIVIRSLPKGDVLWARNEDRAAITCLAFERDRRRIAGPPSVAGGWLLAAGDESGTVKVWDCGAQMPRSVCRGSNYQISSVAFSPDGMTLASTARQFVKLWDIATGRFLLDLGWANVMTAAAFSPDGKLLASSAVAGLGSPGEVRIWQLESDRGIRTLRGLAAQIEKVVLSPDERLLTALSQDCRVAVWDLRTGMLRHIFEAPKVAWVDNAALAISPDNRQLAFAGSTQTSGQALLWDLNSGKEVRTWSFSPGLHNILAFHPTQKLLLFQVETRDGKRLPNSAMAFGKNSPVLRVRDLRAAGPGKPLYEIAEFNQGIDHPRASEDGSTLVLVGYAGIDAAGTRAVKAFDGPTGKEVWSSQPEPSSRGQARLVLWLDRSGRHLTIRSFDAKQSTLVELPSGKLLGLSEPPADAGDYWSPQLPYWLTGSHPTYQTQLALISWGKKEPTIVLGMDVRPCGTSQPFNASGTRFAWGNVDGTVHLADFPEIQRRLAAVGLGW
jgi:serine/threonine protein kinase/WD40 repeat protein